MDEVDFSVRALAREDREWVAHYLDKTWGSTTMVSRGSSYYGHLLPGFIAERDDDDKEKLGLLTYNIAEDAVEIISLNSMEENKGIGTALVDALINAAREGGKVKRIWLITTNDNLPALRFFQQRGFELVAVHRDSIQQARRQKPQIPITGLYGIPIRDEIELEMKL